MNLIFHCRIIVNGLIKSPNEPKSSNEFELTCFFDHAITGRQEKRRDSLFSKFYKGYCPISVLMGINFRSYLLWGFASF